MDYEINTWDTLERIAASHDCTVGELMKLNRMASRIVFPGMKIRVPFPTDDVFDSAQNNRHNTAQKRTSIASENADDGIRKGPGSAVPSVHSMPAKDDRSRTTTVDSAELDAECLQRFLKVKVKQLTETDGTVGGVLLVTPNCLMFDPDVTHALVREKGSDLYGMVANMDDIMAVALYKDIGALTGEKSHQNDVYDPDRVAPQDPASGTTSEEVLPLIVEEELANVGEKPSDTTVQRRHNSDLTSDNAVYGLDDSAFFPEDGLESGSCPSLGRAERPRAQSDLLGSSNANGSNEQQKASRISPRSARRSVLRLGRTLSSRAYSFGGTVASGAQSVAQTAVSSTKNAAHGVVTHTKSAADTLQTGAKAAAGAVASVPQNIVNMSSGLFAPESVGTASGILDVRDTWFAYNEDMQNSPTTMKRQQSLATLETLRLKTQQARDEANSKQNKLKFSCATSLDEMPELFRPVQEMLPAADDNCSSPELPFYLCVRLSRRRKRKRGAAPSVSNDDSAFGNQLKREFWFAVPRERAEAVYHFLLQWSPDKYGQDSLAEKEHDEKGFLILEGDDDDALGGDKPSTPLFGSMLNREWEIVTVEEMRRRLSLSELSLEDLPLPEGATTSRVLDEPMIRQLLEILPARAEGYPWVKVYSSAEHGFSLKTLYRKMADWDEEVSPTLLIVMDIADRVFGAIVSCPVQPSEHFYGTGDSCLLWRFIGDTSYTRQLQSWSWTGDNQLFVNASKESLAIGAGGGHYGLWLDADLNHGRSQRCATFDNENLAGHEDFIVQHVEAFGFRML